MSSYQDFSPLDTEIEVVTPENIRFSYRLAGPFLRAVVFAADVVLLTILVLAVQVSVFMFSGWIADSNGGLHKIITGFVYLFDGFVFWFGNAFLEAFFGGRTLGKAAFGLRVLSIDGRPIRFYQATIRNVVRLVDLLLGPFVFIIMGGNDKAARLGDLAAGTIVVVEDTEKRNRALIRFKRPEIREIVGKIPADFEISSELRKALAVYAHRRTAVSPGRRWEIAFPLANRLARKMNWNGGSFNPDLFLCGVYQWSFQNDER